MRDFFLGNTVQNHMGRFCCGLGDTSPRSLGRLNRDLNEEGFAFSQNLFTLLLKKNDIRSGDFSIPPGLGEVELLHFFGKAFEEEE
jgi:hypothetical protein